jgi:type I restriction enzyme S subunit
MTLDTFFEKFDLFADAPNAVAKMRELVLELAVQGKLVEPPSKPETDKTWLTFRKETGECIDPSATPLFDIPKHWQWCVLAEVADCRASAKVPPSSINDRDWVLDLEDIDGTTGQFIQFATFAERRSLSTKAAFEPGDVLYSKLRPYLNKVVVAEKKGFCTTEIIPLRPATFHEPGFLRIYLRSLTFLNYAAQKNYGMKMPRLGTKDLESAQIPLPPPSEQKRIVAKVDELMALCDRLEAQQLQREEQASALARASLARFAEAPTPPNLNLLFHQFNPIPPADLRKAILAMAVKGKLVPQNSKEESAEKLIARLEEDRHGIAKKQGVRPPKDVPAITEEDHPHHIPKSWQWRRIGHLALVVDYGTSQKSHSDSSKIPVYRMGNIVGGRLIDENLKYVDPTIDDLPKLYLKTDDILFNRTNSYELVGKSGIFTGQDDTNTFASYLIRIRLPSTLLFPTFFSVAMNAPYFRQTQIEPEVVQQCGQANFNGTKLSSTVVPVPPLAEQRRIVVKVDQLMALVDELETQLAASRATAKNLLEALVAELTGK